MGRRRNPAPRAFEAFRASLRSAASYQAAASIREVLDNRRGSATGSL